MLISCGTGVTQSNELQDYIPDGYENVSEMAFLLQNDTLFAVEPSCHCNGNDLVENPLLHQYIFMLNGDSLKINTETLDSINAVGASAEIYLEYSRFDTSSNGYDGVWKLEDISYTHDLPISAYDSILLADRSEYATGSGYDFIVISNNRLAFYSDIESQVFSNRFKIIWEKYFYSYSDNITFVDKNSSTVHLIGNVSNDTVIVNEDSSGNRIYTRKPDASSYPPHIWYLVPSEQQCPNNMYPDWLYDPFLVSNN
jgi:hypothetical protein